MAKRLMEQPSITLNSYDVSADVFSLEIVTGRRAPVDVTGFSDTYDQFLVPNYRNWSVRLGYFNNVTATSATPVGITTVLQSVFLSSQTSGVTLTVKETTGIESVTNPTFQGQVQIDGSFQPIAGGVAEADKGTVTLKGLGNLSWMTSSS